MQIPQKLVYEKFYIHEKILHKRNYRRKFIKLFLVKNAKKTCKPNKRDLNSITSWEYPNISMEQEKVRIWGKNKNCKNVLGTIQTKGM